jgi:PAS domain S-box-containing protein
MAGPGAERDELGELRARLAEAEAALDALRRGDADALVSGGGVVSLRGADKPYHAFFDAMHEGGLTLDAEWRVLYCNSSFTRMMDATVGELRGRSLLEWVPDEDKPDIASLSLHGQAGTAETRLLGFRGISLPVMLSANVINTAGEDLVCVVVTDLSERNEREALLRSVMAEHQASLEEMVRLRTAELQTSEARTRAVLTTILDGVAHIGEYGSVLSVNPALLAMFGYEHEDELLGRNIGVLMPASVASAHAGHMTRYRETGEGTAVGNRREVQGQRKDGSLLPIEVGVSEMKDERGSTFIGVIRDMTAQKAAEAALQAALTTAQKATEVRGRFLANMSHEIRTPLNGVLGFARIGERENAGTPSAEYFTRIVSAGEHLLGVINDILDMSKIEAGKLKVEHAAFSLWATVENVVDLVADRVAAKNLAFPVSLAPDLPQWVLGDKLRLSQILSNLLANAIKFTQSGEVRLQAAVADDLIRFDITDTGIGMTEEQFGRLFQPFEQADSSTTRNFGGSGLGLVISRDLARLMGGDIYAESQYGVGSRFTLQLPLPGTAAPEHATPSPETTGLSLRDLSILVVDDVEVNRLVLEHLLEYEGARMTFAENGQQALDCVAQAGRTAFDLVLMDVQMPVMDGLEATRRLAGMVPSLPVVGLTAHALIEERQRCLAAGMVDVLTKPVVFQTLIECIRQRVSPAKLASMPVMPAASVSPIAVLPEPTLGVRLPNDGAIDWPRLIDQYKGKETFLRRICATAYTTHVTTPAELRQLTIAGDRDAIAFMTHKLKSLAGNILASRLGPAALALEEGLRAGAEVSASVDTLAQELDAVLLELDAFAKGQDVQP